MTDESDILLKLIGDKTKVRPLIGTFVSATAAGCVVDVGGGRIPAQLGPGLMPEVNEPVNVWYIDDRVFMMGPTATKPAKGTVVSVAGGLVTLNTDYGTVVSPYLGSTPAAGQVMGLRWHNGPLALGVLSTSPAPPTPPNAPQTSTSVHRDVFAAADAGSFNRYGWQQQQVWASDSYYGAWFYGSKIADTVPASASIQAVEIFLSIESLFGSAPNFALHSYQAKPAGQPGYGTQQALAPRAGWFALPTAWGDALKAGGGSAGVGVNHGGKNIFRSLAQDGMSGALRITSTY
ncbi:hypothetical protein GA0004736_3423 [Curtobacterium sp. 9128]|uniref:hypothetical protein n=1 Tax=Curtobacterium sp. 9128 TaxID=1793722 RepID=UPI0007D71D95|nr:hypothetical protein [Curtobacterium sp. 9128]SBN64463.1 hypothetical protein GA0004736_3423 [Curtobacterium sp. 9128]